MKRSMTVTLVLSGSLLLGCNRRVVDDNAFVAESNDGAVTNNTYSQGMGYYHSGYGGWYPYPHNYYDSGRGYYHGGSWSAAPDSRVLSASVPAGSAKGAGATHSSSSGSVSRGGFGFHGNSVS